MDDQARLVYQLFIDIIQSSKVPDNRYSTNYTQRVLGEFLQLTPA
jgi:hypothetical protein